MTPTSSNFFLKKVTKPARQAKADYKGGNLVKTFGCVHAQQDGKCDAVIKNNPCQYLMYYDE